MFRGLYGQASRSAYRHNSAWPTLPYRSTFAILKTAKHHGNKKIMDKKVLKMYETPAVEIVELEAEAQILAGSTEESNIPGTNTETPGDEI